LVHGKKALDRLHFNNQALRQQDVHPVSAVQPDAFVLGGHGYLPFKGDVIFCQFSADAFFVDTLQ